MTQESSPLSPGSPLLDPAALRISPAARNAGQRLRPQTDLKIRKPKADEWVTIHRHAAFRWESFYAYEKDLKHLLLLPALYDQLESYVQRNFHEHDFYLTAVLEADPIVWVVKHSDTEYFRSMRSAVELALGNWVQLQSNQVDKLYNFRSPSAKYPEPDWLGMETPEDAGRLFQALFCDKVIDRLDHPVLERLRGEK